MAHYACNNAEVGTEIYNHQWIQLSNNKFSNGILGGTLDQAGLSVNFVKNHEPIMRVLNFVIFPKS